MSASRLILCLTTLLVLAGCSTTRAPQQPQRSEAEVKAQIVRLLPATVKDRNGWAQDIYTAFDTQKIYPSTENICAVLAVTEQESTYQVDPPVPNMGKIAQDEILRRAGKVHVPAFVVRSALQLNSPTGKTYAERLSGARTEKDLSGIFDDFISVVPLSNTLFGGFNPVHTAGPMQVSIDFAQKQARGYPYTVDGTIRREVFTRRGGMYFGIAHLLGYPVNYDQPLYRFADFNAGWYASRNAAFQAAVSRVTGTELTLDGDLIRYGSLLPGSTELAVRSLGAKLDMRNPSIRSQLEQGEQLDFEDTTLYKRVFALADQAAGKPLPRAILPGIVLKSPKITRNLTTAWFANRVDERYQRCMKR